MNGWRRVALLALAAAGTADAAPAVYDLDPDHSRVGFELLHFGTSTLRGRFGPVAGTVTIDRDAGSGEIGVRIATAAVSTGVPVLDARLRRDDLLAPAAYPEAFFVARRFRFDGANVAEVRGEFTLRGTSQPLSLTARHFDCVADVATRRERCGGDFEAVIRRSEFGMTYGLPFVADEVRLLVQVEALRR